MDFHCHLDLYPDARCIYAEALAKNEFTWAVTTSPRAYEATSRVFTPSKRILVSPGLHPEVAHIKAAELELLLTQLANVKAIGEIGLDGSPRYRQHYMLQKAIFSKVVAISEQLGGRILSVHSRMAVSDILTYFQQYPGFGLAVLHWFSGSATELRRASALNCWFSVGPAMLTSANGRYLTSLMPKDRVVPESDGPFAKKGSIPILPWEATSIAVVLAGLWKMSPEDVSAILRVNGEYLIDQIYLK